MGNRNLTCGRCGHEWTANIDPRQREIICVRCGIRQDPQKLATRASLQRWAEKEQK